MNATFDDRPRRPSSAESSRWKPFAFAVAVHLALVAMLAIGVAWKTSEPAPVEVELWSATPQFTPKGNPPPPVPDPVVTPPQPQVVQPPPPVVDPAPAVPDPEIALQKARDEARKKADAQRQADLEEQKRVAAQRQADLDAARKQQEIRAAEQTKADAAQKKLEDQKKAADDAKAKAQREADFKKQLAALSSMAGTQAGSASGTSAVNSGPRGGSSGYAGRVGQIIRGNTVFGADVPGNPVVEFDVQLDPAGGIIKITKTKPSGISGFDDAVENAINKTAPFPPDGVRPPPVVHIVHRLKAE